MKLQAQYNDGQESPPFHTFPRYLKEQTNPSCLIGNIRFAVVDSTNNLACVRRVNAENRLLRLGRPTTFEALFAIDLSNGCQYQALNDQKKEKRQLTCPHSLRAQKWCSSRSFLVLTFFAAGVPKVRVPSSGS